MLDALSTLDVICHDWEECANDIDGVKALVRARMSYSSHPLLGVDAVYLADLLPNEDSNLSAKQSLEGHKKSTFLLNGNNRLLLAEWAGENT